MAATSSSCSHLSAGRKETPKRVLIVVTAGGYSNAAPLLEIASILQSRGYITELATFAGRETWVENKPFVSRLHIIGPAVPRDVEEAKYLRMSDWPGDPTFNWGVIFDTKMFLESSWPDAYRGLSKLMNDPVTRPDMLLTDYWVDAARDMSAEHGVPLAMHWPQMPTNMLPAPYIPGAAGLQIQVLTSEHATLRQRLWSAFSPLTALPHLLRYSRWVSRMRSIVGGVPRKLPTLSKPDYLCLVNSFFGLEAAKDLPPNVVAVGPILGPDPEETALEARYKEFLSCRHRVLYVSLGTHVLLPERTMAHLLSGVLASLGPGGIDGVIWAMRPMARQQLDLSAVVNVPNIAPEPRGDGGHDDTRGRSRTNHQPLSMTMLNLLRNAHPSVLFVEHAPQRALLHDNRVAAFLSHAGPASANEALYAGIPLVTVPVYFDQVQVAMRLRDAGVSVPLDKDRLSAAQVSCAIRTAVGGGREHDVEERGGGDMATNVERMRRIARVASRRKYLAADLVEEVLADAEARRAEGCGRGMHLQPADGRMPAWKARNWDIYAVVAVGVLGILAVVVVLPIAMVTGTQRWWRQGG